VFINLPWLTRSFQIMFQEYRKLLQQLQS